MALPIITLRPALLADADRLALWDQQPHVITCSSDDPDAEVAFGNIERCQERHAWIVIPAEAQRSAGTAKT